MFSAKERLFSFRILLFINEILKRKTASPAGINRARICRKRRPSPQQNKRKVATPATSVCFTNKLRVASMKTASKGMLAEEEAGKFPRRLRRCPRKALTCIAINNILSENSLLKKREDEHSSFNTNVHCVYIGYIQREEA
jgi:hypothetical protein